MNKKTIVIFITAAIMTLVSGCSANNGTDPAAVTTTAPAAVVTTEKPPVATENINTATTAESTDYPLEILESGSNGNGYISWTEDKVDEALQSSGVNKVKPLNRDVVDQDIESGANNNVLYKFMMYNDSPAALVGDVYVTELSLDGNGYYVVLGDNATSSQDEIEFYCQTGSTWIYWGYVTVNENGGYLVMPLVAGSEDDGYWAVRPVLSFIGADTSMIEPHSTGGNAQPEETTAQEVGGNSSSGEYEITKDKVYIVMRVAEQHDDYDVVEFTIANGFSYGIWLNDMTVTLNGEDISDDFESYFAADASSVYTDRVSLYDNKIEAGDALVVTATLVNTDTYEDVGEISFPFEF